MQVLIKNFDLKLFKSLIEQNLLVQNEISINFGPEVVKSYAFTSSKSLMKIWTVSTKSLIKESEEGGVIDFDDDDLTPKSTELEFEPFDFYVLKGDMFKKYLSIFNDEPVTMIIEVDEETNIGTLMTIQGCSAYQSRLQTKYNLCSDELIVNKISSFDQAMQMVQESEDDMHFVMTKEECDEVKKLIQQLHKSNPENTSFITFKVDVARKIINVSDKVFSVNFQLQKSADIEIPSKSFEFNLLKSDFISTGNHVFHFFVEDKPQGKVILKAAYKNCINIYCTGYAITYDKQEENTTVSDIDSVSDDVIDIDEYFGDN